MLVPETPDQRRERHLRACKELAELGMELARAAAREAMRALEAPIEHRVPSTPKPPVCDTAEPGILFTRLSRAVRQAILLEARIAAGAFDRRPGFTPIEHRPAAPFQASASPASAPHGDGRAYDPRERLEDDLAADAHRSIPEIFGEIRQQLGLTADADASTVPPRSPESGPTRRASDPDAPSRTDRPASPLRRGMHSRPKLKPS